MPYISPIYYSIIFFALGRLYYGIQLVSKKVIAIRIGFSVTTSFIFILSPIVIDLIISNNQDGVLFTLSMIAITIFGIGMIFFIEHSIRHTINFLNVDISMLEEGITKTLNQSGIKYTKNNNTFNLAELNIVIEYKKAGTLAPVGQLIVNGKGDKKTIFKTMYESVPIMLHDKKLSKFPLIGTLVIAGAILVLLLIGGFVYVISR